MPTWTIRSLSIRCISLYPVACYLDMMHTLQTQGDAPSCDEEASVQVLYIWFHFRFSEHQDVRFILICIIRISGISSAQLHRALCRILLPTSNEPYEVNLRKLPDCLSFFLYKCMFCTVNALLISRSKPVGTKGRTRVS
jgi:hypothetical protein